MKPDYSDPESWPKLSLQPKPSSLAADNLQPEAAALRNIADAYHCTQTFLNQIKADFLLL